MQGLRRRRHQVELYNLENDLRESTNLAESQPARVAEMLDGFIEVSIPDGVLPPAPGHAGVTVESSVPIVGEARAHLTIRVPGDVAVGIHSAGKYAVGHGAGRGQRPLAGLRRYMRAGRRDV